MKSSKTQLGKNGLQVEQNATLCLMGCQTMLGEFRNEHTLTFYLWFMRTFFNDNTDKSPPQVIRMLLGM